MTALLCWGSSEFQEETNAKGAWQGVRAKSSLYNIFTRENEMDKDSRRQMLRTDATTSFEITNEANFVNNGIPVTKFYNVYKDGSYNIFTRENEMDKDSRRQMLRTDATTNFEITNEANFVNNGIPVTKFYNVYKDGSKPASSEAWTDFPLFRLGEIYLNLAEAVLRGGQGATKAEALGYLNDLRKRAYMDKLAAPISDSEFTLDFMLDERGREMFYEGQIYRW